MNEWSKKSVVEKLQEISQKGFLSIPEGMYRNDDGIVGQILEREFGINENNLHIADLGQYELKGMRKRKSGTLTLFHQTSTAGMTPIQIFERFSYIRTSRRDGTIKRKLFTTIYGNKENSLGFILRASSSYNVDLYYHDEYLATWDLSSGIEKIQKVLLAFAETQGARNTREEKFHFVSAYILSSPKNIYEAISTGAVVMDLCIDQPVDGSKPIHDRGPHIRIPIKKLDTLFSLVEKVL
ncbi:MAG TPA: hypothetical protein GXZ65_05905 [Clostridiales bacterium]|jgi:hypothetical protein|nr:hypothetical protein [Clostridiales bacterium]